MKYFKKNIITLKFIKCSFFNIKNQKSFESKHGCILCIGYAIGKFYNFLQNKLYIKLNEDQKSQLRNIMTIIISFLQDPYLCVAAILSLGEIARNGQLIFETLNQLTNLVDVLNKKILTTKETNKVKEKAAATLGFLCINENIIMDQSIQNKIEFSDENKKFDSFNKFVMHKLLNSAQAKQFELHMAIGEALVNAALGSGSKASQNNWTTIVQTEESYEKATNQIDLNATRENENIEWLLKEIINTYLPSQNQHLRQAACFWLLIVLKNCARECATIHKNLYQIQDAFIDKLGENDEITQEVASKGIGILFAIANDEQKQALIARIVDVLGGGSGKKKPPAMVKITNENEEIFKPDQIGNCS